MTDKIKTTKEYEVLTTAATNAVKLTGKLKLADVDAKAKELGMSRAKAVNTALDLFFNMESKVILKMLNLSLSLEVPPSVVVQNTLIKNSMEMQKDRGKSYSILEELFPRGIDSEGNIKTLTGSDFQTFLDDKAERELNELNGVSPAKRAFRTLRLS